MLTTCRADISAHRKLANVFYSNHRIVDAVCLYRIEDNESDYSWREIEEDLSKWLDITTEEVVSLYDNNILQTIEKPNLFTITINISKVKNARMRDRHSIRSAYSKLISAMKKRA
jgi:hypothetical protein